jgi:RNA polymerase sigma-70 factor (ECF subfamily)
LQLDVSRLQFVDPTGVALLHGLEREGAVLGGCSGFIGELLRERGRATTASQPAQMAPPVGDAMLVERLRGGDPQAFEMLVREYGGRMLATARRLVGTDDEARDVLQEAFLAAFRAIDTFAGAARLSTWLHRIVTNAALMRLRSRHRRREEPISGLLPRFDDEGRWVDAPSWDAATDGLLEQRETRVIVRDAIDHLPPKYRTVLVMRDIEELNTVETATLLGITQSAVKIRLHRGRQALRALLQKQFSDRRHAATAGRDRHYPPSTQEPRRNRGRAAGIQRTWRKPVGAPE